MVNIKAMVMYKLGDKVLCVYSIAYPLPDDKVLQHLVYRSYVVSESNIEFINNNTNNYTKSWTK